jgi:hypothetical protein
VNGDGWIKKVELRLVESSLHVGPAKFSEVKGGKGTAARCIIYDVKHGVDKVVASSCTECTCMWSSGQTLCMVSATCRWMDWRRLVSLGHTHLNLTVYVYVLYLVSIQAFIWSIIIWIFTPTYVRTRSCIRMISRSTRGKRAHCSVLQTEIE